eukprot:m.52465 g.52465  ORF g.52465 m.52465 type:complete len:77 (-) comp9103_c0_seq4:1207-1437(-)
MAAARCLSKQVTVVSYNVLAPTLCSVDRFVTSNPKNLDPEARFKKVTTTELVVRSVHEQTTSDCAHASPTTARNFT